MIVEIPSNVNKVRLSDGQWVDVPEDERRIESTDLWNDGEEFLTPEVEETAPVEAQPEEAPVVEATPSYAPDIPFEQAEAIETKYANKIQALQKAKQESEGDETMASQYDALIANVPQEKYKEQQQAELDYLKLKTARNKAQEQEAPVEDPIEGMEATATAFGISTYKFFEPIGALAVLSEDLENQVRDLVGAEQVHGVRNWFAENQKTINDLERRMGYEEGDIFTPSNIGSAGFNLAAIALPFLRAGQYAAAGTAAATTAGMQALKTTATGTTAKITSKELAHDLRVATAYEGGAEAAKGVVEGETYGESALRGYTASAVTMAGGKLIGSIIERIPALGGEGILYGRFKETLNMTPEQENIYLQRYADVMGIDAQTMNEGQKATAIAFGNPNARQVLYQGLTKSDADQLHAQFNNYAKELGNDLYSKIDTTDILGAQKLVREADELRGQAWNEFDNIIATHYGDINVPIKEGTELNNLLQSLATDSNTAGMLMEGKVNLPAFKKLKTNFYNRFIKPNKGQQLNQAEREQFNKRLDTLDQLNKVYKEHLPEMMHDSYDTLSKLERMKRHADIKGLFSTFKFEGTNIEPKHLNRIVDEMRAPAKGSSYDNFIRLMGKRSEASNRIEGTLVNNIIKKQDEEGFINFMKVYNKIDDEVAPLQFKTPQGKALKTLLGKYKDVFANIKDLEKTELPKGSGENTLTMNPLMRAAYAIHAVAFKKTAQFLGVGKDARKLYVVKHLPKVLDMKSMPKGYTLKEQRGAISFSRFFNRLKEIGEQSAEEMEIGQKGGYYESSQMIGEEGAQRMYTENQILHPDDMDEAISNMTIPQDARRIFEAGDVTDPKHIKKTWEKTGWYFDQVDDRFKFHLDGKDVKLKAGKDKFFTESNNLTLEDIIDMPAVFNAYPELKGRTIHITAMFNPETGKVAKNAKGYYSPFDGSIGINRAHNWAKDVDENPVPPIKNIKETLVHEIQHAIQSLEGFASGGSTGRLTHREYLSLHGEVEARALTRGGAGTKYPKEFYAEEYFKDHHVDWDMGEKIMRPLHTDRPSYRGKPPATRGRKEKIPPKTGIWDDVSP